MLHIIVISLHGVQDDTWVCSQTETSDAVRIGSPYAQCTGNSLVSMISKTKSYRYFEK